MHRIVVGRTFRLSARFACLVALSLVVSDISAEDAPRPFGIQVLDAENGWPVPLVELRTTHELSYFTDNAGRVAVDAPELLDREVWFHVRADGYEADKDGFGFRGRRFQVRPGGEAKLEVRRTAIAKRIGRLTGAGLFAESQKLSKDMDWRDGPILGCDSVQMATLGDRRLWLWGDTNVARYPLGLFHMSAAYTSLEPLPSCEPPLRPVYRPIVDEEGAAVAVAEMPGSGPTWLTAPIALEDREGRTRIGATYAKIAPPLETYELGLCVFNAESERFERHRVLWEKSSGKERPPAPDGHACAFTDANGDRWVLFGNPLPRLRCRARFEAWESPQAWEVLEAPETLRAARAPEAESKGNGSKESERSGEREERRERREDARVRPHSGSVAYSEHRKRWVTVFMEKFGKPSAFGELWYAEAPTPFGPWGRAVKVVSHANYSFYNPRIDQEFAPPDASFVLFEATYTALFADSPKPTPRYDYNQLLYRIDLDDPRLAPAQTSESRR